KSNLIRARIRRYPVTIELENRTITHNDCVDWSKLASEKSFCKHVGKLLLALPEDEAKTIITDILSKKDFWQFHTNPQ
ncbi:MAG: hypothetical protein QG670_1154, partial [Thermoproteota archaeon]|nr:hypothetical protein [Thermoproteota archaeon]